MFLRRAVIAAGGSAVALFAAVSVGKSGDDLVSLWPHVHPGRWDRNWDYREPMSLINLNDLNGCTEKEREDKLKKCDAKVSRHIYLIRHGQYNDADCESERTLTGKGREQADLTGQRLAALANEGINFNGIVYSSLTRSTETADIVAYQYFKDGPRIEAAFRKYIHRADPEQTKDSYEIIVCHDNVIRYFVCRALQFQPDGWLRMSLYHGSITKMVVYSNGDVSLVTLGDAGYMPPGKLSGA
ncbi:serine threonine- phosphatase PGAM5, mitochondrial isoform X1 [Pelobates cultripes]|uniref:Serine/threonine-protein phosphatase PGAM5, mitochondrial n=1 Tax=Pelobates cultripes TaxID=61616 RepID=A0AAD1SEC4_PELCU|nr:serine threonine- phosphatase PGAM5, mitochondrial isoform X1 [Pelobates cultripes]